MADHITNERTVLTGHGVLRVSRDGGKTYTDVLNVSECEITVTDTISKCEAYKDEQSRIRRVVAAIEYGKERIFEPEGSDLRVEFAGEKK